MGSDSGLLSPQVKSHLNMMLVVMATLLIGNALHISVVTNEYAVTAPLVVFQLVAGGVFGLVGVRFRKAPRERWGGSEEESEEGEEFDAEMSPLDEEDLDRLDE